MSNVYNDLYILDVISLRILFLKFPSHISETFYLIKFLFHYGEKYVSRIFSANES